MAQFAIDEVLTTGIQISGFIFDYSSSLGTPGQVLACTSSGVMWQADSSNADLASLSGQIAATGTLLNNRINSLSGYSNATFATITNLATTGSVLDTKINTLSGYSNANFATILNLAATGSVLDTKINTLSGYSNANFATILNLAATGSVLDTKINTLSGYSNANFATITNLAATGSVLDTKINTLSGYAGNTFLSGVGVANYVPRWSGTKLLVTGSIYDDGTNVGIGTTVPGALLDVNGVFRFQEEIRVNNGTNKLILSATSTTTELHSAGAIGTIFKGAGNNEIARFDAANFNVGIGTATVSRKLHVYVDTGPVMRLQSSGSNASIEFIPSTIQNRYNWLIGAQQNISDAFEITPSTATNGTTFSNPAVLITSAGNVGIGTVSPTTLLSVGGAGSTSAASGLTFGGDASANLYRISSSRIKTDGSLTIDGGGGGATNLLLNRSSISNENGMAFNTAGVTDWYFYVDNGNNNLQIQKSSEIDTAPRVRFDGSNSNILFNLGGGNVGIGTSIPQGRLHVSGATDHVLFLKQGVTGSQGGVYLENADGYAISSARLHFISGDSVLFTRGPSNLAWSVSQNANVGIGVSNPSEKLTITGAVKILTRGGANFKVGDGSNNNTFLEFDYPDISTADAHFRLFRSTNTNGGKYFQIFKGDSSATSQTLLNANGDSHINAVAGNLGIGTDSPTQKLQVSGTVKIQSLGVYSDPTDNAAFLNYDTNGGIFTLSARSDGGNTYMAFRTSNGGTGSEKVRVTNDGNVGINQTSPAYKLDVNGTSRFANDILSNGNITIAKSSAYLYLNGNNGDAEIYFLSGSANRWAMGMNVGDATENLNIYNYTTATTNFTILKANGNVGIGTANPLKLLHVHGTTGEVARLSVASSYTAGYGPQLSFWNATTEELASIRGVFNETSQGNRANLIFGTRTSDALGVETKMTIFHNGNVGIGTNNPSAKLEVFSGNAIIRNDNAGGVASLYIRNWAASPSTQLVFGNSTNDDSSTTLDLNSNVFSITNYGDPGSYIKFGTRNASTAEIRVTIDPSGRVGIGTEIPSTLLSIGGVGSTSPFSGITFGADSVANLYRISSSRIKTDGSLEAAVGIISPTITSLSGNIAATGSVLDTKINTLSGYSNATFATITNLAATGSVLDTKINTTNTNLAATGSTLDTKINTLSGYAGSTFLSGQGVANWTARWNGTKELITGSIYDLGTGVGIGTSSPGARLDIAGTTNFQSDTFSLGVNIHYDKSFAYFYGRTGSANKGNILFNNGSASNLVFGEIASDIYSFGPGASGAAPTSNTLTLDNLNTRVGVGLANPQKELDVISSANDFVTVGARTLSIGGWAGVHFGYRQDSNSYRKSAIVFERTDLTSSNAQGKVHILNGPQAGGGNATLADSKLTIDEGGKVGIGTINPIYKLDITGPATSNGVTLRLNDAASVADSRHILLTRASVQASIGVAGSKTDDPLWISRSSGYDLMIDLNGRVGLGVVNPATLLGVGGAGSTTAASGITFGADAQANLYRSAEDTLRTDGALIAGGYLRALSYVQLVTDLYPGSYTDNLNLNIGNTAGNAWETAIKIKPGSYVGIGTTQPTGKLHVVSSIPSETVLKIDGTNGTLFSVVDDLSDSLMSVNNSAGLPVLEVFADDRVVAGQYGSGDFVLINNKVGIGTTNPTYKLEVNGNFAAGGTSTIGTTYPQLTINGTTNQHTYVVINRTNYEAGVQLATNGTAKWYMYMPPADDTTLRFNSQAYGDSLTIKNNGNVGIGTTNPSFKLHTAGAGFIGRQNSYGTYDAADADLIISNYNSDNTSILLFNSAGAYNSSLINYYNNILSLGLNNDNSSNLILTSTSINITAAGVGVGLTNPAAILNVKTSTTANREVFMGDSTAVVGVFRARLDDNSLSFISLENRDINTVVDHGVGIRFNLGTNASSNAINAGGIYLGKEQTWTATASTQDSYLIFNTSLDGTASEKVRITSAGTVGIGTSVITGLLNVTRNSNTAQPIAFFKELYGSPAATNILLLERGNNLSAANQTTSNAGLRIRDHSSDYSLSIEDHNSNVNFAISGSKVLVGSRGTNSLLNVGGAGSVAAASGLTFGEDASANLYRSAASTIKTDGSLIVAGNVTATNLVSGNGTANFITKWNDTKSIANSQIFDDGTYVGINTAANTTYRLQVIGSFAATTKSFDITHPTASGKRLAHASLEGPENGVYYRGQNDNSEINLPHYWSGLVHDDSITVDLTSIGKRKDGKIRGYSVDQIGDNKVYIYTDSDDNIYNYYYTIFAERKDVSKLVIERDME